MEAATADLNIPLGAPNWMDLVTNDVDAGVAFYTQLFGWTAVDTPPEFEGYKYFTKDGKAVGGCMRNDPAWGAPNAWSIYLNTDNADAVAQAAKDHGGDVMMPTMKVFDNGSMVIVRDCGGAAISAWQPEKERGFGILNEPGAPSHFELFTRDYDKTVQFYADVFKWNPQSLSDEAEFRYTGFGPMEAPVAGIMDATSFLPESVPAHWSVYLNVSDIDDTVRRAKELGGAVIAAPEQTPYGQLATLSDPTGAVFKLQS